MLCGVISFLDFHVKNERNTISLLLLDFINRKLNIMRFGTSVVQIFVWRAIVYAFSQVFFLQFHYTLVFYCTTSKFYIAFNDM